MMKTVILGGKEFEITPPNLRNSMVWRERFATPILEGLSSVGGMVNTQLNDTNDLIGVAKSLGALLLNSMDALVEAMLAYSEALSAEREWILDHATDQEAVDALVVIIGLAYPFGSILAKFQPHTVK